MLRTTFGMFTRKLQSEPADATSCCLRNPTSPERTGRATRRDVADSLDPSVRDKFVELRSAIDESGAGPDDDVF